jgi:hypothetical protein
VVRIVARRETHRTDHPFLTMAENAAPYEIVSQLLEGTAPPRPLFLPIVFAHGARIENVPLRSFLANPTKISNSLRQLRTRLRSDGVTCYFDPFLESEALGARLEWPADDRPPLLRWPEQRMASPAAELSGSAPGSVGGGRVPVAVEVIRRLKATLRSGALLMASVSGPLTLAASLAQLDAKSGLDRPDVPESDLDLAASAITPIATALLEAGASTILIREDFLPAMSEESFADWCSRLAPIVNIVRFYRALPVLLLGCAHGVRANRDKILGASWDCVLCPVVDRNTPATLLFPLGPSAFGLALAPDLFEAGTAAADFNSWVREIVSELRPAVLTTAGDLSAAVDIERLNKLWENLQHP